MLILPMDGIDESASLRAGFSRFSSLYPSVVITSNQLESRKGSTNNCEV